MTTAQKLRDRARTVGAAHRATRGIDATRRLLLRGRVEGLLIAAHVAEGSAYEPCGIDAEADAYLANRAPDVLDCPSHDEIMAAWRARND